MLRFFLEHSFQAISARRLWLLLALVPLVVYLVVSAAVPDRFMVRQEVSLSGNDLIALSPKPGDLKAVSELVSSPHYFFLNKFALVLVGQRLEMNMGGKEAGEFLPALKKEVEGCLSFTVTEGRAVVSYDGGDRLRGRVMVAFYAQRIIQQAGDWLKKNRKGLDKSGPVPKLLGKITTSEHCSLWRSDRLLPSVILFFGPLLIIMTVIALAAWFTPSFRSERHMADYLKVPILGTSPDLERIAETLKPTA
jgi:hypothetical protein